MQEGWHKDEYLIIFERNEASKMTSAYRMETFIPGHTVFGLQGWDNFIIKNRDEELFTVPTIPVVMDYVESYTLPKTLKSLEADPRFIGRIKWYTKPVVFGGDPHDPDNLNWVTHEQHIELVNWWNDQYKSTA